MIYDVGLLLVYEFRTHSIRHFSRVCFCLCCNCTVCGVANLVNRYKFEEKHFKLEPRIVAAEYIHCRANIRPVGLKFCAGLKAERRCIACSVLVNVTNYHCQCGQ